MRKPLATRIVGLAVLYCAVFFVIVILQFSNKGSFSVSAGDMTIRGRSQGSSLLENDETAIEVTSGVRIYFGGLEFTLNEERGKGLTLVSSNSSVSVNPENLIMTENGASFFLPGGTVITFNSISTESSSELQINASFADDIKEVFIPITQRRSSLIRDNDQLGIMYGGSRYLFAGAGQELQEGRIVLSRENSFISYRSRARQRAFDTADFIVAQAANYESALLNWREESFIKWNQNATALQNDYEIAGYCAEALGRGSYIAATNAISADFINSARNSFRAAPFVGGMTNAHRTFTSHETSKTNLITSMVRDSSPALFKEERVLDYLFARSNTNLAYEVIDLIGTLPAEAITSDHCPGLLEASSDLKRWRPAAGNPIEPLTDRILAVICENLVRDKEKDLVLASNSEGTNAEFSLRLGRALMDWAAISMDFEWAEIGKSLVLSALKQEGAGHGRLYGMINQETNYPKALWLMDNGLWAWTAATSARASYIDGNINVAFTFPVNMTHHVIIRGVRPFIKLQMHGQDWRTDSQFERYDSSGWVYYPQDQILVLKLRHREAVENVRIFYRVDEPAPVVPAEPETQEEQY